MYSFNAPSETVYKAIEAHPGSIPALCMAFNTTHAGFITASRLADNAGENGIQNTNLLKEYVNGCTIGKVIDSTVIDMYSNSVVTVALERYCGYFETNESMAAEDQINSHGNMLHTILKSRDHSELVRKYVKQISSSGLDDGKKMRRIALLAEYI